MIFVVTQSTVECREFTELVSLKLVLTFWDRGGLVIISQQTYWNGALVTFRFYHIVDEFLGFVDLLFGVGHDQAMQVFFLVAGVSCVRSTFSFFDGSFATDGDFGQ